MMKNKSGMTLIELIVVMAIFSIVIAGLYSSYKVLVTQGLKEFQRTESNIELAVAKNIIERDLVMTGYGIPDRKAAYQYVPALKSMNPLRPIAATDGGLSNPDTLTLTGTALGMGSRAAQSWTYGNTAHAPAVVSFHTWPDDPREALRPEDIVVMTEPTTGSYVLSSSLSDDWLFQYQDFDQNLVSVPSNDTPNYAQNAAHVFLYGLYSSSSSTVVFNTTQPASSVTYHLGGTSPSNCAPGTQSLLRSELRTAASSTSGGQPILSCVLDFEVALGLDTDDDGTIDGWDNGGAYKANTYSLDQLSRSVKQIRAYVLVQNGARDLNYVYANPDGNFAPDEIRVGDLTLSAINGGGVGRTVPIGNDQLHYRWQMLQFVVTPRNIR